MLLKSMYFEITFYERRSRGKLYASLLIFMADTYYCFMIVGVGGTGGNFAKEFCKYVAYLPKNKREHICISFIDGDRVEKKNCTRQPFIVDDVELYKANALAAAVGDTYGVDVLAYTRYIDTVDDLNGLYKRMKEHLKVHTYYNATIIPVIIGCVDNHRARQVMHEFYQSCANCIYFDSANEFSVGEVVFASRVKSNELSPPRGYYFPEILKDKSPSKSEESCGVINESSPQHLVTNLMAANILLSASVLLISDGKISDGIVYFDALNFMMRSVPYSRILKHKEGIAV